MLSKRPSFLGLKSASLAACAFLAGAGLAAAQPLPAPGQGAGSGPDLVSLLHLRPDQVAAFHALEAAGRPPPAERARLQAKAQQMPTATTPERLAFQEEVMTMQVDAFHHVAEAERRFYALLSPEQKHSFDQLTAPHPQQGPPPR
jgi:hypothetical protein